MTGITHIKVFLEKMKSTDLLAMKSTEVMDRISTLDTLRGNGTTLVSLLREPR